MTIFYKFEGKMYINLTNGCPCKCVFCIRDNADSISGNDSLWLEHEPTMEEIVRASTKRVFPRRYSADTASLW